jgi:hypothetical protein
MAFSLRLILLLAAVVLFVLAVFMDDPTDWWSWGLAAFAAAFLVTEGGWDRRFGGPGPDRT